MLIPRHVLLILLMALALPVVVTGCGDAVQSPNGPKVDLTLTVSSETVFRGETFSAEAQVHKRWGLSVLYSRDCCGIGIQIDIRDASGTAVASNICPAACIPSPEELPDQGLARELQFDGKVWRDGKDVDIPPGVYTVVATFWYDGQNLEVRHEVTWVDARA
jgi:hypothetical protein